MAFGVLFMQAGLTGDIVQKISDEKDDPVWMREFRMKSLQIYRQMQIPDWGRRSTGWTWTILRLMCARKRRCAENGLRRAP